MDNIITTADPTAHVRLLLRGPLYEALEEWRRRQARIPPMAEAVRQMIARGLHAAEVTHDAG